MMRKVILLLASMAAAVLLATGVALATSVTEVEPNNSIEEAQNIDADKFSLDEDPIITDSTTVPHATINGTGNFTNDYYSFDVPEAAVNKTGIFDMDQNPQQFQNTIWLYGSNGVEIAHSSDSTEYFGTSPDQGSAQRSDGYLKHTFTEAGTYYMKVSNFYDGRSYDPPIPPTTSYKLHLSIPGVDSAPKVTSTVPQDLTTNVLKTADVTATFSEAVQNVNTTTFKLERKIVTNKGTKYEPVAATVTTSNNDTTAVLNPTKDLPKGDYRATITTGVTDTAGNALSAPYTWTFKVQK